ncbi:aromatic ring-hydroxylating oxygenase subunit alpha [Paraburkholderia acidipaludis]|uniref:aromatic ring-hydroxylating oxygenase subunit alpha n=1 Tax=Paraburkholderia acidipaludis TaxID=660537 RepID=UPI0005BB0426|nr:ring-hydroxylating oxygenase subunit alpha [Paraburkholderia acidipaludis]
MTYLPIEFHKQSKLPKLPADFCSNPNLAWTIPASYYTAESVYKVEEKKIFENTWICVAHRSELAEANAYITREIIGESILVVRGKDKVLRAFYNVCPHRGHQLLEGSGKAKNVITCPYHAWAFKLDGVLAHANNCDHVEAFDKENSSLVPVRVEEYAGFVFINLNPEAGNVESQLPGLEASMREACPVIDDLKLAARFVTETPANWKSIVDNYLECYHCGPAHPGFSDSVRVDKYTHTLHGNWTLQFGHAQSSERSFKLDPSITDPSFHGYWAWPCTMFNVPPGSNFMTVIYEFPVNAEVTLQHYDIYFLNEEPTEEQQKLIEWYRTVFRPEDLRLVESVQKGLKSRGYRGQGRIMVDPQRSGISEHGIAHFHNMIAQYYQD